MDNSLPEHKDLFARLDALDFLKRNDGLRMI